MLRMTAKADTRIQDLRSQFGGTWECEMINFNVRCYRGIVREHKIEVSEGWPGGWFVKVDDISQLKVYDPIDCIVRILDQLDSAVDRP